MATNDKLFQSIKEVGDLRESIGAARAHVEAARMKFETARANLSSLESQLAQREKEVESLVRSRAQEKPTRARAASPASVISKVVSTVVDEPRRGAQDAPHPLALRRGSLATRIVELLNGSPNRSYSAADMSEHFDMEIRQLYGTLSRLTRRGMIVRVSDGVFRAARGGVAAT